ncbi:MAG: restriction endonuclease subunit S [Patescibacteria group bacterium]
MKFIKFSQLLDFQKKSHIKAGDGLSEGSFSFFTSSPILSKLINTSQFNLPSLIFGTGGSASVHICEKPFSVSTDCLVAQLKPEALGKFDIKFVYYYLFGNIEILENGFKGAGLKHISKGYINNIDIPELSFEDQKRIVKIINKADALRQKRKQAIRYLDDYLKSVFLEKFGDIVKNDKKWEIKKLNDLCDVGSSKRVFVDELKKEGVPFYRGTEIGMLSCGKNIKTSLFITNKHYQKLKKHSGIPIIGDLLMPSICPDGRIWLVDSEQPFYFKDGRVLWIHMREKTLNNIYLLYLLKEKFKKEYKSIASGTTFAEIKIFALKGLSVLLPPIEFQDRFALIVRKTESLKNSMLVQSAELESQFNILIQKAFKGEL